MLIIALIAAFNVFWAVVMASSPGWSAAANWIAVGFCLGLLVTMAEERMRR